MFYLYLDIPYPYSRSLCVIFLCLVTQTCSTLCASMDYSPPGSSGLWGFSRKDYWSVLPCPPPGDLPNPGMEPRYPSLQVDSLPTEPSRKRSEMNTTQLCLILCDPMGYTVHGILQARLLGPCNF